MKKQNQVCYKRAAFHAFAAIHFWYSCYYDWYYVHIPEGLRKRSSGSFDPGKLKYLTFWNGVIQAVFFTICFLNDLIGTNTHNPEKKPTVRIVKDMVLAAIAFPLAMFVGLTFWILYAIDRELIFPKILDSFFPTWLNHAMHTNIMIFIFIEMYSSFRKYPKRNVGFKILVSVLVVYLIWMHILYVCSGYWVYPFLDLFNLPFRIIFYLVMLIISFVMYLLGEKLNTLIWTATLETIEKTA